MFVISHQQKRTTQFYCVWPLLASVRLRVIKTEEENYLMLYTSSPIVYMNIRAPGCKEEGWRNANMSWQEYVVKLSNKFSASVLLQNNSCHSAEAFKMFLAFFTWNRYYYPVMCMNGCCCCSFTTTFTLLWMSHLPLTDCYFFYFYVTLDPLGSFVLSVEGEWL